MKRFILPLACTAAVFYSLAAGGACLGAAPAAEPFVIICLAISVLVYALHRGEKNE